MDGSLGYLRDKFPLSDGAVETASRKRWKLQSVAARLIPEMRVSKCYRYVKDGSGAVSIERNIKTGKAFFGGLQTCGSVWVCPICSAKITEARRVELTKAVSEWSGSLVMVTVTLQHEWSDELKQLLTALKDAWKRVKSGRKWLKMRDEYGLSHYVTSTELTYGEFGWHPHLHCLFFSSLPESEFDKTRFQSELTSHYLTLLEKHGFYAHEHYGIDVRMGDEVAGNYVSKYGLEHELTKSVSKAGRSGRSPFQLLDDYANGDKQAGALFREYAEVFFNARQLSWSHGARAALGLSEEETPDEEIAAEEPEPEERQVLAVLTPKEFALIALADIRAETLEIASHGDMEQLALYLKIAVGIEIPLICPYNSSQDESGSAMDISGDDDTGATIMSEPSQTPEEAERLAKANEYIRSWNAGERGSYSRIASQQARKRKSKDSIASEHSTASLFEPEQA